MAPSPPVSSGEPIAVIGSGCRFPGSSNSPSKLWKLLREPRDLLTKVPPARFITDSFYHSDPMHHGATNVTESYFLEEDHRVFDAGFFNIKGVEAHAMDPQQRLLLETVYESLESAGLSIESLTGSQTGVFVGLMCGDYSEHLQRDINSLPTYMPTGTARSIMSNRISYFFDWHGPCMTIDTACSSSLVAVHQAIQLLRSGESDVAISAGSNLILGPELYIGESKLKMLSPGGRSRMWDFNADGYARGEGVAAVVLKRLSTAIEDGDDIECVIRESGVNQDGRTKGITMPSQRAQADLIAKTYAKSGLDPRNPTQRCQYFESHGTGTPAGDPCEAEAISSAFFGPDCRSHDPEDLLYVGSIKTVIGHSEGTAGIAGLLKASLAVQHGVIPPNMLFDTLSPAVEPFYTNLEIPTSPRPWPNLPTGCPRRASVNSFGFGGTNAHLIVENFSRPKANKAFSPTQFTPFVFSAASEQALRAMLASYTTYIRGNPDLNLQDLSYTLYAKRSALPIRAAFSATSAQSLALKIKERLEAAQKEEGKSILVGVRTSTSSPSILGVFTGQGAQWATMGRELVLNSSYVRNIVEDQDMMLQNLPEFDRPTWSIMDELLADASTSRLGEALIAQPLCTIIQIILVDLLQATGLKFKAVVGHSSGEIAAAYAAGFLTRSDAVKIAYYRGLCTKFAGQGRQGAMMAVGTSMDDATELCNLPMFEGRLCVAAYTSSSSVTISGDLDAIEEAKEVFEEEKTFVRILKVDKAYHSWHMLPCSTPYLNALRDCHIEIQSPRSDCAWYSSTYENTKMKSQGELSTVYWKDNMVQPVLFTQAIQAATAGEGPFNIAVEIGPHPTLKGPAVQGLHELGAQSVLYTGLLSRGMDDIEAFSAGLGYIWSQFSPTLVEIGEYDRLTSNGQTRQHIKSLPLYPWNHDKVFWHDSRASRIFRTRKHRPHPLLGSRMIDESSKEIRWRNVLQPNELPWIRCHRLQRQMGFPAVAYIITAVEACQFIADGRLIGLVEVCDFHLGKPCTFDEDDSGVEIVFCLSDISKEDTKSLSATFTYHACPNQEADVLTTLATGRVIVTFGEFSSNWLPPRTAEPSNVVPVHEDQFYSSLQHLGYEYTGDFRSLSSMKRKLNFGAADVTVPPQNTLDEVVLIHPGLLDSAFQAMFLAYWWPNDGSLESLHVPTHVDRVLINFSLCQQDLIPGTKLELCSHLTENPLTTSTIRGDVDIFGADRSSKLIQVEGVQVVPFSEVGPDADREMFSEHVWNVENPDCGLAVGDDCATADDYELATIMERVAIFYLKNLQRTISKEERETLNLEWHHHCLFRFASHIISQVQGSKLPFAKREWLDDTWEDIAAGKAKYDDRVEMKLICVVGENLAAAVRGETNMLQHLLADNLLNSFYEEAMGPKELTQFLAKTVHQVVHRFPHMKILEIGAGTGGATKAITHHIGQVFSSYTFTDISTGFFESAQEVFASYGEKMIFKALDIEKDIVEQGYKEHSYDLIIGSLVLHATADLRKTLDNTRKLLRPGGYLIILEITNNDVVRVGFCMSGLPGWWLGQNDGRTLSPCVSVAEWQSLLLKTGFSKADSITPERDALPRPMSVIVSQAIDQRISILREPLEYPEARTEIGSPELVIIGGQTDRTRPLVINIVQILQPLEIAVTCIPSFEEIEVSKISPASIALILTDLDNPIFKDFTARTMSGLKLFFESQRTVLWVTQGCRAEEPFMSMTIGFGRSLVLELPDLRLQFLDIDFSDKPDPRILVVALLRLHISSVWEKEGKFDDVLWMNEQELRYQKGKAMIPRLYFNRKLNNRFNASKRTILENKNVRTSAINLRHSALGYSLCENLSLPSVSEQMDACVSDFNVVEVSYALLQPVAISGSNPIYSVLGTHALTGKSVICFSSSNGSRVAIQPKQSIPISLAEEEKLRLLLLLDLELKTDSILSFCSHEFPILVHEPDWELAKRILERASVDGVLVFFISAQPGPFHDSWITIHPNSPSRQIKEFLPPRLSTFVNCSETPDAKVLASIIATCLPQECLRTTLSELLTQTQFAKLDEKDLTQHLRHSVSRALEQLHVGAKASVNSVVKTPEELIQTDFTNVPESTVVDWSRRTSVPMMMQTVDGHVHFAQDKTYVLFGLTSDLAQSVCEWMASHGARNIVLTSRNPKINIRWISQLKVAGVRLEVYSNDITNKESLTNIVSRIRGSFPPIAGVAHGAMVLEDASFFEMPFETMQRVLRPKVQGAINLDNLFQDESLDFLIFFSSVAAIVGNRGQSAYSTANMFMTSLAFQRRQRGLAASILHIGAVVGVGYVTRELSEKHFQAVRKAGFMWMSERGFHLCFAEAVLASHPRSGRNPEIVTGMNMITSADKEPSPWTKFPRFQHCVHEQNGKEVKLDQRKANIAIKVRLLEASSDKEIFEIVTDAFFGKLHLALQLPSETFGSQILSSDADDLGIDSLIAVEVRSWFLKELEIDMPVLKILSGGTIADLISFAVDKLPAELTPKREAAPSTISRLSQYDQQKGTAMIAPLTEHVLSEKATSRTSNSSSDEDRLSSVTSRSPTELVSSTVSDPQRELQKLLPMSLGQSRFWFLRHFLEDQTTSNVTFTVQVKGSIRLNDLENAIEILGARHEALRTCFFMDDFQRPMQGVFESSSLHLEKVTLKDQSQVSQEFALMKNHVYDIERGETIRVIHLSLEPSLSYLIIGYHHINMDGVSLEVFLNDLEKAYNHQALPQPVYQYTDYSRKLAQQLEKGEMEAELNYWKSELVDLPPSLPLLPFSSTMRRTPVEKYEHNMESRRVETSLASQIKSMCQNRKVNVVHFYLAVFGILLFKLLDTPDFCFGMADANRDDQTRKSLGMYMNLLPLRFRLEASKTFEDVLKEARKQAYSGMANARLPFDTILEEINTPRKTLHSPLFQAFINYRQGVSEQRKFGDSQTQGGEYALGRTAYDLNLDIIDNPGGQTLVTFLVQKQLYSNRDASKLLGVYFNLLDHFSSAPTSRLEDASSFVSEEVSNALKLCQGPNITAQWQETLAHRVDEMATKNPDAIAIDGISGTKWTYRQMITKSNQIAAALMKQNVAPLSPVAVYEEPSPEWIFSLLAVMFMGGIYVPLDLSIPRARLATILKSCQPSAILVDESTALKLDGLNLSRDISIVNVCSVSEPTSYVIQIRARACDPAAILFTSGTTGIPKGVILSHEALRNHDEGVTHKHGFGAEAVLQQSALSFDLSLNQIFVALGNGGSLVIVPRSFRGDPVAIIKLIIDKGITYTSATPSEYLSWLQYGFTDASRSKTWRFATSGGEQYPLKLWEEFKKLQHLLGHEFRTFNAYGPTEVSLSSNETEISLKKQPDQQVTAGHALPNCSFHIVDDDLNPLPVGMPGEVCVGGAGVALGYLNDDDGTKRKFVHDPFASSFSVSKGWTRRYRTGDRGVLRDDGALEILGRVEGDTQIKLRGLRIEMEDIENTILRSANGVIAKAVVIPQGEPLVLIAHVVFSSTFASQNPSSFLQQLASSLPLPQYMRPAAIIPINAIPLTTHGKIDRQALALEPITDGFESHPESKPLTSTESRVRKIWHEVLPSHTRLVDKIDTDSDFFQVGGSSMLLIKLRELIANKFGTSLSIMRLFEYSTLGAMVSALEDSTSIKSTDIDWEYETDIPTEYSGRISHQPVKVEIAKLRRVILTGSTGFLGKEVLRQLIALPSIEKVHCIAVRSHEKLDDFSDSVKLKIHRGDLAIPRLGLPEEVAESIFGEADAIIHNGADVSFLKTYQSLKGPNVDSTKELVRLSLARRLPVHYISTMSLLRLTRSEKYGAHSLAPFPPPPGFADGYAATKWVSEVFLEKANAKLGLPVWIHRPSSITGEGAGDLDVMSNMLKFGRTMKAVPDTSGWKGSLDFISVEQAAKRILKELIGEHRAGELTATPTSTPLIHVHQSGELVMPVGDMQRFLETESGTSFEVLSLRAWIDKAVENGLSSLVAEYLCSFVGKEGIVFD